MTASWQREVAMIPVRWSGLALAIALALGGDLVEAAVAMLVALAQVVAWRTGLPRGWEIALSGVALVAAISSYLDLYARWSWWDLPVHCVLTGLVGVLGAWVWKRREVQAWHVLVCGSALAVIWELMEQWGHHRVDASIHVPAADTLGDLMAGVIGAALAGWWFARGLRAGRMSRHLSNDGG